ncbi:MAG: hypothetical protein BA863_00660 [Desulfovibrio sp. S3730MH75]|nr:MAG: hypothetical protein BA863_00660 [Desulfovibrio sp. S3730MH75]
MKQLVIVIALTVLSLASNGWAASTVNRIVIPSSAETAKELTTTIKEKLTQLGITHFDKRSRLLEIYYDYPDFSLLRENRSLRFVAQEKFTWKGRQKFNEQSEFMDETGRLYYFPVKHYEKAERFEGKHPFFRLIKRAYREDALTFLETVGVKQPLKTKQMFAISKLTHTMHLMEGEKRVGMAFIEKVYLSSTYEYLGSVVYVHQKDTYPALQTFSEWLSEKYDVPISVHGMKESRNNNYKMVFQSIEKNHPLLLFKLKNPVWSIVLMTIAYTMIGLLILKLLFRKHFSFRDLFSNK